MEVKNLYNDIYRKSNVDAINRYYLARYFAVTNSANEKGYAERWDFNLFLFYTLLLETRIANALITIPVLLKL